MKHSSIKNTIYYLFRLSKSNNYLTFYSVLAELFDYLYLYFKLFGSKANLICRNRIQFDVGENVCSG